MRTAKRILLLGPLGGAGLPPWIVNPTNPPDVFFDFAHNRAWKKAGGLSAAASLLTVSRASNKTNLFPTSASGFAYSTFLSNAASITSLGLSVEEARTNVLLNSTAPVTQTTASLGTGTYTLWVNGSGSATSSAGSATITGAGAATNGTPNVFVVTVAGTVTVTVSGSLNAFQCELGTFGTSLIVTGGAAATRAADVVTLTSPPAFGSAYSFYAKVTPQAPTSYSVNQYLFEIDDGTESNRLLLFRTLAGAGLSARYSTTAGGNLYSQISVAAMAQGSSAKTAIAATTGDQQAQLNGTPLTSGLGVGSFTPTVVHFGVAASTAFWWNGFIEQVAIWASQRVPNAQLQSMTT